MNIVNKKEITKELKQKIKELGVSLPEPSLKWLNSTYFNHVIKESPHQVMLHPKTVVNLAQLLKECLHSTINTSELLHAAARKKLVEERALADSLRPEGEKRRPRKRRSMYVDSSEMHHTLKHLLDHPEVLASEMPMEDWVMENTAYHKINPVFNELSDLCDVLGSSYIEKKLKSLSKINVEAMLDTHGEWIAYLNRKAKTDEDFSSLRQVCSLHDKFDDRELVMVELISKRNFAREGHMQKNCVSSYYGKRKRGKVRTFSLRDPDNKPIVTIACNIKMVLNPNCEEFEIHGTITSARATLAKPNMPCSEQQLEILEPWFKSSGFAIDLESDRKTNPDGEEDDSDEEDESFDDRSYDSDDSDNSDESDISDNDSSDD